MSIVVSRFLVALTVTGVALGLAVARGDVSAAGEPQAQRTPPSAVASQQALLDKYCVTCHNERLKTGGLALDALDVAHVDTGAETWEKVLRKVRTGAMPPAGMPRPDPTTFDSFASWLETELDEAFAANPNPGKLPAFQRLTRTEYQNAVRDLLALPNLPKEMDIELLLPADNASSGFDNIRDLLFVSSTQLEQYLSAARKISRLAVGDPEIPLIVDSYVSSNELPQDAHVPGAPFGTRGGTVVRTHLPLDGEYALTVHLADVPRQREELEVIVDGERVHVFAVAPPPPVKVETKDTSFEETGTIKFERDLAGQARKAYIAKGFTVQVPLKAGPRTIVATFLQHTSALPERELRERLRNRGWQTAIEAVTVKGPVTRTGPGETPSRRHIFVCRPTTSADEGRCARQILSTMARRAYRRAVVDADLRPLLESYASGHAQDGFEGGIQQAIERLLVSPQFLFRIERDPAKAPANPIRPISNSLRNGVHSISDVELASRLSFFLWSSIPDDELLDVAIQGKLRNPQVLERQVRRMLQDVRSEALVTNFGAQWLFLRDLRAFNANTRLFGDFDAGLKDAFERETELLLSSVLRAEDRSVLDLLTANHTFVNERLAKHYGIPYVYGSDFRRVVLSDDSPRRGLLGQASLLTLSSHATRTSPVLRGKYILDNLLATPPPPPPPNIPALAVATSDGKPLPVRQALAQHRANPVCASCHSRMDPLGFALENFDAIGRWRSRTETGEPIDASASLPDGTKFDGVAGLRQLLLSRPEQFVTGFTEKLFTYAVGRKLAYYDSPGIRKIVRDAAPRKYRFSAVVLGIVNSVAFTTRQASAPSEKMTASR